ncbi:cell division protein ZipA C-terminal FtsZ-binding domain-containing protein [Vreelandella zhanjiangensis]|uniref:cell division protein ZipA C-terminal FtsZ-binding domain-containing protein n=1 Tax=Vreelandella zhanjiangensis TaxID=1121960 RepID=UPI00036954BE|nr:cell division protein ZipA C-terminal FtsZ-binding domain-containing protein [Halomonas zhanjiangensis]
MENTSLATLLALGSMLLGCVALALFVFIVRPIRQRKKAQAVLKKQSQEKVAVSDVPEPAPAPVHAKPAAKVSQHSLFIIFAEPGQVTEQTLTQWLKQINADYDPLKKIFLVAGQQPANPITIANAFLPGELPDLFRDESADDPIKGISLIVKPPLRKRRNQQMIAFVAIAKEAAALFNADVLDTQHQSATEETYQQIIG